MLQLCSRAALPALPSARGSAGLSPRRAPARARPTPPMLGGARGPALRPPARSILPQEGTPGPEKSARHPLAASHPCLQRDLKPEQDVLLSLSSLARGLGPFSCPKLPACTFRRSKTHPAPGEVQPHDSRSDPDFGSWDSCFCPPFPS